MTLDLTATIQAAAGLPPDAQLDGINLLPYVTQPGKSLPPRALFWRFWGQSAVRAGDSLTMTEMASLMEQLSRCDLRQTCPHGRPTMIHLSHTQLAREFGR